MGDDEQPVAEMPPKQAGTMAAAAHKLRAFVRQAEMSDDRGRDGVVEGARAEGAGPERPAAADRDPPREDRRGHGDRATLTVASLDLCVSLDEPEQLIRELAKVAEVRMLENPIHLLGRGSWKMIAEWAKELQWRLDRVNEAVSRR